ncbi:MAG: GH3 auxin-responsive promoter family protein, partial [Bacteroidaceae bacterium]|nr:GH3 auxin-responsive promoter family protein [Bacteroidaceae bacterium]
MDLITSIVRTVMHYRVRAIRRYATDYESIQRKTLRQLIRQASGTCWGKMYGYDTIQDYKDYAKRVPVSKYSSIKPYVMRMLDGEPNVLWPGQIRYFAQSSGTTCDAAKFIPVSRQGLKHCHLMGGKDVTATFLDTHPGSHAGLGYSLVLAGVCAPVKPGSRIMVGDISSIMSRAIPGFFRRMLHL